MIAGQISAMAPDYIAAKVSAARCFAILDREPVIDAYSTEGKTLVRKPVAFFCFLLIIKPLLVYVRGRDYQPVCWICLFSPCFFLTDTRH